MSYGAHDKVRFVDLQAMPFNEVLPLIIDMNDRLLLAAYKLVSQ